MNYKEQREIEEKVALAMGWEKKQEGWWIDNKRKGQRAPLRFCTDPAAAEVLWREIDYREWDWSIAHYQQGEPGKYQASVGFSGDIGWRLFNRTSETSPWEALCLAFLAVHEFAEEKRPWRRLNAAVEAEKATAQEASGPG